MGLTESIRDFVRRNQLPFIFASLAEDYIKRFAENNYDRLAKTRLFMKLKKRSHQEKLVIELGMYSFNAYLKRRINTNTPLGMLIGGIVTDFFFDMGKRLINGKDSSDPDEQEVIELVRAAGEEEFYYKPESKAHFFGLETEEVNKWLEERLERKRRKRYGQDSKTNT